MSRCSKNAWAPQLNNLSQNDCGKDKGSETSQRHRPRNPICSSTPPPPIHPTPDPGTSSEACPGATRFAPKTPEPVPERVPERPEPLRRHRTLPGTPGACPGLEACKMILLRLLSVAPFCEAPCGHVAATVKESHER